MFSDPGKVRVCRNQTGTLFKLSMLSRLLPVDVEVLWCGFPNSTAFGKVKMALKPLFLKVIPVDEGLPVRNTRLLTIP